MGKLNKIFKISSTDFATLKENGEITKAGVTYKYDPDNLYLIENNLTDDYVLLGAGGSKLESELSVKKAEQDGNGSVIADTYVKKVSGKDLSTNDYTTAEKTKLSGIATGANKTTITNNLTTTSTGTALDAAQGKILNDKFTSGLYEANLRWGGKNLTGTVSPTDAAMIPKLSANRFDFFPADHIKVEYSTDGGTTWIDYGVSDKEKINLVSSTYENPALFLGKKDTSNTKTVNDRLKVTLFNIGEYIYTGLRKFMFYVATNAHSDCWVTIRKNTHEDKDTFTEITTKAPLVGWSGWNMVNLSNSTIVTDGNSSEAGQTNAIEFIFGADTVRYQNYASMYLQKLFAFHETCYSVNTKMAVLGTPYVLRYDKSAEFMGAVKATILYENGTSISSKYALKTAIPTVESLTTTDIDNAIK